MKNLPDLLKCNENQPTRTGGGWTQITRSEAVKIRACNLCQNPPHLGLQPPPPRVWPQCPKCIFYPMIRGGTHETQQINDCLFPKQGKHKVYLQKEQNLSKQRLFLVLGLKFLKQKQSQVCRWSLSHFQQSTLSSHTWGGHHPKALEILQETRIADQSG